MVYLSYFLFVKSYHVLETFWSTELNLGEFCHTKTLFGLQKSDLAIYSHTRYQIEIRGKTHPR